MKEKTLLGLGLFIILGFFLGCMGPKKTVMTTEKEKYQVKQQTDPNGFTYETVSNDPTGLRLYTLENGLKVYLSKNTDTPKIQTLISIRAGSVYDPSDNTGLAHYLEHLLFKGTHKLGTTDWEKEKIFLSQISDLFEEHKAEKDPEKKKVIYKKIDSLSKQASKISIAAEYDKAAASIGCEGTNAHTWHEETVYKNVIPSNELSKWLLLEKERFSNLVLRIFHTELETVYEEFNRGQDSETRRVMYAALDALFPVHPYGQQTTIGKAEHLKNPSMKAIHKYFDKYYVPNNMAVILVGDLDFDSTIKQVNDTFGQFKSKAVEHPQLPKEKSLDSILKREVWGPEQEKFSMYYRTAGINSKEEKYITLIDRILSNRKAGLIDINLNQKQKVLRASSSPFFFNDYGILTLSGNPKQGQSLDEVKALLLEQIELIKKGAFEDWLIEAIINDEKLQGIKTYENNNAVARVYSDAFVHFSDWIERLKFLDELKKISKSELVAFANDFFKRNYVEVHKRQGEAKGLIKVDKPSITSVELNKDKESDFLRNFKEIPSQEIKPVYVDYKTAIHTKKTKDSLEVSYINNPSNDLFELDLIFDMGEFNIKKLPLAMSYLSYLGTPKYSAEDLSKEFYRLGISFDANASDDRSTIELSGLKDNLGAGLELLEYLIDSCQVDKEAYDKLASRIIKSRENKKSSMGGLFNGLVSYNMYGKNSPLRDPISNKALKSLDPQELVALIKSLKGYKQRIFYYGKDVDNAVNILEKYHHIPKNLKDYPPKKIYKNVDTGHAVYLVNHDMVQSLMLLIAKRGPLDMKLLPSIRLFNEYFSGGMSSIVFQEVREARSLAYSVGGAYLQAKEVGKPDYIYLQAGTQANKLPQASEVSKELLTVELPKNEKSFINAKTSLLKSIATNRIIKSNIFWSYERLKKLGIDYDTRKEIYEQVSRMSFKDLMEFYKNRVKNGHYTLSVIGNKKDIDTKALKQFGEYKELSVDDLFNY